MINYPTITEYTMENIIDRIETLLMELEREIDIEMKEKEDLKEENERLEEEIDKLKEEKCCGNDI